MSTGVLPNDKHSSETSFGLDVTLESVVVSTLLQTLKSFGFHLVDEVFGGSNCELQQGIIIGKNEGAHLQRWVTGSKED